MNLEAWKLSEEKKKLELSEKEKESRLKKEALDKEIRQKLSIQEWSDDSLSHLKEIIEHNDIDSDIVDRVQEMNEDGVLDNNEIQEILDIISDMQDADDIQKYLPPDLIISQDDFKNALVNDKYRQDVLIKLDSALGILYQHADTWMSWLGMIGMVAMVLDKKLVTIQENHIDIQNALEKQDSAKQPWFFAQLKKIFIQR